MRYATWNIVFEDNSGTFPNELSGQFFINKSLIAGYLPEDFDISQYSKWSVTEISSDEFLALALNVNNTSRLENGHLVYDIPDILKGGIL